MTFSTHFPIDRLYLYIFAGENIPDLRRFHMYIIDIVS